MNNYIVFVNGLLTSPDVKGLTIVTGNSIVHGAHAEISFPADWQPPGGAIKSVDIFEIRGGSLTKRYRREAAEDGKEEHVKRDEYVVTHRCLSTPGAF